MVLRLASFFSVDFSENVFCFVLLHILASLKMWILVIFKSNLKKDIKWIFVNLLLN